MRDTVPASACVSFSWNAGEGGVKQERVPPEGLWRRGGDVCFVTEKEKVFFGRVGTRGKLSACISTTASIKWVCVHVSNQTNACFHAHFIPYRTLGKVTRWSFQVVSHNGPLDTSRTAQDRKRSVFWCHSIFSI